MESFFQRMSSIVLRSNTKEDMETEDDESERQRQFRHLQERRRSAPDIRRRGLLNERLLRTANQKGTSEEQIPTHLTTATSPWRTPLNSVGEYFSLRRLSYLLKINYRSGRKISK